MAAPDYSPTSNAFSAQDDFPSTATGVTLPDGVDAVFCDFAYTGSVRFDTIVNESWGGKEKRHAKKPPRLIFKLVFDNLTVADADALFHHFLAQEGRLYAFSYFEYLSETEYTVRYDMDMMDRETFLHEAEKTGITLIEVL